MIAFDWAAKSRDEWAQTYREGATLQEIANDAGVHLSTVHRYLKSEGVAMRQRGRTPGAPDSAHPNRRLDWDTADWAEMYRGGATLQEIADVVGASQLTVLRAMIALGVSMRPACRRTAA